MIFEGDSVGMFGDHDQVVCLDCFDTLPGAHLDCAGLHFPELTLEA